MKTSRNRIWFFSAFLLAMCGLAFSAAGQTAKPVPKLTGRVVDLAGMISSGSRDALNGRLIEHEKKTGNQVVVLTIPSLQGEALEDYSLRVARGWALGQKDKDNGVLFLIAKNDRKMRIEVGYGLEGTLTDAISGFIIRSTVRPLFKREFFDGGIVAGTGQIIEVLEADAELLGEWKERSTKQTSWHNLLFFAIWGMVFFGGFLSSFLVRIFGREIKPGHYRWLGFDAGINAPRPHRSSSRRGGGGRRGGGFSGGGGGFGGGGSSGGW